MEITFISDTHTQHRYLTDDLVGGDLIVHSGDISSMGKPREIRSFLEWFETLPYTYKIFIAGNHDWGFQNNRKEILSMVEEFDVIYLQDEFVEIDSVKIYGTPWQPEFYNWAFNLPRGEIINKVWSLIPNDIDVLITHGPPFGHLDNASKDNCKLGCEGLLNRIEVVKPKIHAFGHIHGGYGYKEFKGIHLINAASLDEAYDYTNKPLTIDWDPKTNYFKFI